MANVHQRRRARLHRARHPELQEAPEVVEEVVEEKPKANKKSKLLKKKSTKKSEK